MNVGRDPTCDLMLNEVLFTSSTDEDLHLVKVSRVQFQLQMTGANAVLDVGWQVDEYGRMQTDFKLVPMAQFKDSLDQRKWETRSGTRSSGPACSEWGRLSFYVTPWTQFLLCAGYQDKPNGLGYGLYWRGCKEWQRGQIILQPVRNYEMKVKVPLGHY